MADRESGYKVVRGRPPLYARFQFGGCSALSPVAGLGPATHAFFSPIEDLGQNVGGRNRSATGGEGCARDLHNLGFNKPRRSGRRTRPATAPPKGQSGNPGGRSAKSLPALLADPLNETAS
jgi:hypothetical protein